MRTRGTGKRTVLLAVALAVATVTAAAVLSGCGSTQSETSSYSSSAPPAQQHVAAAPPAVTEPLSMDQIAFDSPVRRVKDKNGLEFLHFEYTDAGGKVYKCVMPAAMADAKRTPTEWLATFDVYREPEAVATKAVRRTPSEHLGDFPFISPKPKEQAKSAEETTVKPQTPMPMPRLPQLPSSGPRSSSYPAAPDMSGRTPSSSID